MPKSRAIFEIFIVPFRLKIDKSNFLLVVVKTYVLTTSVVVAKGDN
jgi:hypothetical protein